MEKRSFTFNDLFGGLYGFIVGDALGVPVEFTAREQRERHPVTGMRGYGTHRQPKGTWSDDTSMVLATMDAMNRNIWSTNTIMSNFYRWLNLGEYTANGKVFDVGGTTARAIAEYMRGEVPEKCGGTSVKANGNGSLMRMLPVIYFFARSYGSKITKEAVEFIYNLSSLTHAHIISKKACVYYVYIGLDLLENRKKDSIQNIIAKAIERVAQYYAEDHNDLECNLLEVVTYPINKIQSTGYVVHSLGATLWSLCNTNSFEDAVLTAVNLGGDTDTIGALTGGLAGIYYGAGSIPLDWLDALRNKALINDICNRFYEKYK